MAGRKPKQENANRGHREGTFEKLPTKDVRHWLKERQREREKEIEEK